MKFIQMLVCAVMCMFVTSCSVLTKEAQRNVSETQTQSRANIAPNGETADVYKQAITAGQINKLISSATQNIDKGYRLQAGGRDVVRDIDGNVVYQEVLTPDGKTVKVPLYTEWTDDQSLNSYLELPENLEGATFKVGDIYQPTSGNRFYSSTPVRNGLSISITKSGGAGVAAEAIAAYSGGHAAEREATGDALERAVKAEWVGKISLLENGVVEVIKQTGESVIGKLIKLTPYGAAAEAAEVVLEKDGVVQKFIGPNPEAN